MSYHRGQHYYALCDHTGDRRCEAFILPPVRWDPTPSSSVLTPRADVYNAAHEAGWHVDSDLTLCPQHAPKKTTEVTP